MNTRRMNRLEELGRVDAEKAFTKKGARNLKDEKKRIVRELKADGGKVKRRPAPRPKTGRPQTPRDEQRKRKMSPFNLPKGLTLIEVKKDGGKVKMPKVGPKKERPKNLRDLKPVKPSQRGLRKLPTKVRNKMGYMKDGGSVALKSPDKVKIQIKKGPGKPKGKRRSYQEVRRDRGMGKALRGGGCVR